MVGQTSQTNVGCPLKFQLRFTPSIYGPITYPTYLTPTVLGGNCILIAVFKFKFMFESHT